MTRYRIGSEIFEAGDEGLPAACRIAYERRARPHCLCQSDGTATMAGTPGKEGIAMYLAKCDDRHIIKRMPDSGPLHDPACEHFEAPAALSGLGDVMGKAILEAADGSAVLKLGFSLTRHGNHLTPTPSDHPSETVKAQPSKLSLRSLLHYIWHEAGLHRWNPGIARQGRNWRHVRSALFDAVNMKMAKKAPLRDRLYIPEQWHSKFRDEIEGRRQAFTAAFRPDRTQKRELVLIIAELTGIEPARYGYKMLLKHSPSWSLFTDADTITAIGKRYKHEMGIAGSMPDTHMILMATASINEADIATLEEFSLMLVDDNFIPFENIDEYRLIRDLTLLGRSFVKGLRFNVDDRPLATILLTDVRPPLAMYVLPPDPDQHWTELICEMTNENQIDAWIWNPGDSVRPDIPPRFDIPMLTYQGETV